MQTSDVLSVSKAPQGKPVDKNRIASLAKKVDQLDPSRTIQRAQQYRGLRVKIPTNYRHALSKRYLLREEVPLVMLETQKIQELEVTLIKNADSY